MKWCTKLETAKERCPIVFQGHPSNFKVTRYKTSPILTQIGRFRTIGQSQLSNPSDLPCFNSHNGISLNAITNKVSILNIAIQGSYINTGCAYLVTVVSLITFAWPMYQNQPTFHYMVSLCVDAIVTRGSLFGSYRDMGWTFVLLKKYSIGVLLGLYSLSGRTITRISRKVSQPRDSSLDFPNGS